jgi:ribosomal protein S18 acetylase RimI-like enzyme
MYFVDKIEVFDVGQLPSPSLIAKVLTLQQKLIVNRDSILPVTGFLVSAFAPGELTQILTGGGRLQVAWAGQRPVGFSLTTGSELFTHLYRPRELGTLELFTDFIIRAERYLYQMAVDPDWIRRGVGSQLLEIEKKEAPEGLFCDVLEAPLRNSASVQFFVNRGFVPVGKLSLPRYRDFGELKSLVLAFPPSVPTDRNTLFRPGLPKNKPLP